eukprot:TRINITY_DN30473_c0_g1_i1.p1 TRINITY_DN30473_c0_g1~~TRINITY_DN30473_c0_g1_i1.p1  ORF type:complete len:388 (-),score=21.61 TRINITY_DN30473_c0_g1_i1:245-1408(-)
MALWHCVLFLYALSADAYRLRERNGDNRHGRYDSKYMCTDFFDSAQCANMTYVGYLKDCNRRRRRYARHKSPANLLKNICTSACESDYLLFPRVAYTRSASTSTAPKDPKVSVIKTFDYDCDGDLFSCPCIIPSEIEKRCLKLLEQPESNNAASCKIGQPPSSLGSQCGKEAQSNYDWRVGIYGYVIGYDYVHDATLDFRRGGWYEYTKSGECTDEMISMAKEARLFLEYGCNEKRYVCGRQDLYLGDFGYKFNEILDESYYNEAVAVHCAKGWSTDVAEPIDKQEATLRRYCPCRVRSKAELWTVEEYHPNPRTQASQSYLKATTSSLSSIFSGDSQKLNDALMKSVCGQSNEFCLTCVATMNKHSFVSGDYQKNETVRFQCVCSD